MGTGLPFERVRPARSWRTFTGRAPENLRELAGSDRGRFWDRCPHCGSEVLVGLMTPTYHDFTCPHCRHTWMRFNPLLVVRVRR